MTSRGGFWPSSGVQVAVGAPQMAAAGEEVDRSPRGDEQRDSVELANRA